MRLFLGPARRLPAFSLVASLVIGAVAVGPHARTDGQAAAAERNVVLYVVDDQGSNDAGCYGNSVIKTPGLDELARTGTRFTHGFCTTASCSASRSVILTGLHNHANGQYGHEHSYHHFATFESVKSLPALLKGAGYRTASLGKYHVAPRSVYPFDVFGGGSPTAMAEKAGAFMAEDEEKPFFIYLCTHEPHRPFSRDGSDTFDPADVIVPPYLPDTPACRKELAQYYGSVQRADAGLVQLLKELDDRGHADDTLVIYVSDNGIAFPGAKTTLYEPGMRLPLVVRNPYAERGGLVTDAMVTWADITPTILDFTGKFPRPPKFHGRSFLEATTRERVEDFDEVFASHTFHEITMYYPMRVVRTRRHKLIWNIAHGLEYPFASDLYASATWQDIVDRGATTYGKRSVQAYLHRPKFELYDLKDDPHEVKNLADDPAHAELLAQMQGKLRQFQKDTGDPWILKWKYE